MPSAGDVACIRGQRRAQRDGVYGPGIVVLDPLYLWQRWHYAELDVPIALPGQTTASVPVRPGDLIHGDRDGVLVIPREHSASVAADAEEMERLEGKIKLDLEAGADREEVYRRNDRFAHIKKVR